MDTSKYQIVINIVQSKWIREGMKLSAAQANLAQPARPDAKNPRVEINIEGMDTPAWTYSLATKMVDNGSRSPHEIADRIIAAINLIDGREMISKYAGRDVLTSEVINAGEAIVYSKKSGAAKVESLRAIVEA